MTYGKTLIGRRQVLAGVEKMVAEVQIEATFPDGTKLLTVHSPIAAEDGDLAEALKGSFLPTPDLKVFDDPAMSKGGETIEGGNPGAVLVNDEAGGITLNVGRGSVELAVTNTGDRPIQVGSHYHFIETNGALVFDRAQSYGKRLNIVSGSSVRFEPGESKTVTLVDIAGNRKVVSGNRLVDGPASPERLPEGMDRVKAGKFGNVESGAEVKGVPKILSRAEYAGTFGPTTGDRIALGE